VNEGFGGLLGQSSALKTILSQIELVAPTEASVLILGESGTGKELIARALHDRSNRAHRALVKVNCASIPRDLFESEFFGHAKGSLTGALRDRVGRFQLADGGTLFLDEVAEIPLECNRNCSVCCRRANLSGLARIVLVR
jgi:transcriptional regulator with GAF, ATPase, and Fis domain